MARCYIADMGWLSLVGSIKLYVAFAKEPYKRDDILLKRPIILSILLTVAPLICSKYRHYLVLEFTIYFGFRIHFCFWEYSLNYGFLWTRTLKNKLYDFCVVAVETFR